MRVASVVFSYCPADPRVRRETEALVDADMEVDLICLRGDGQPWFEQCDGTRYYRLPIKRKRGGKFRYIWEYTAFTLCAMFLLAGLHLRRWYRLVHVHNMPDVLVASAIVPKLFGAKIVLDLHDPMPEVFMAKYGIAREHALIGFLIRLERWSIWFADVVVTPNIGFRDLFIERGCPDHKIRVVMNAPQESIFGELDIAKALAPRSEDDPADGTPLRLMFHGTVVERHGLGTALDALAMLGEFGKDVRFDVYGDGDFVERFLELVDEKELGDRVTYNGQVPLETIADAIDGIDLGLIPNERSVFTEINMPTRIFEYLCKGKPVIVPRTKGICDYFGDDEIFFFEPGNARSLAESIECVSSDAVLRGRVLARGFQIYQKHSWQNQRRRWLSIVHELLGNKLPDAVVRRGSEESLKQVDRVVAEDRISLRSRKT